MRARIAFAAALACAACSSREPAADPFAGRRWIDLSHAYDEQTVFWPTGKPFTHERTAWGTTEQGYFYSSYDFSMSEHSGTHLDAPIHFAEGGKTVGEIPLDDLAGPAVVIDVSAACAADADYLVSAEDVARHEAEHGAIPAGAIALVRTGWSPRWPSVKDYLGDDRPGRADDLHFPGLSPEAAEALLARKVKAVGIDTASLDRGASREFPVHQILAAASVPGLENLSNLDALPARGAYLIAMPMKIGAGSGAPCRVGALAPDY